MDENTNQQIFFRRRVNIMLLYSIINDTGD